MSILELAESGNCFENKGEFCPDKLSECFAREMSRCDVSFRVLPDPGPSPVAVCLSCLACKFVYFACFSTCTGHHLLLSL